MIGISSKAGNNDSQPMPYAELQKEYTRAVDELRKMRVILAQERRRWEAIHQNPTPDQMTSTVTKDGVDITVSIDTPVKNIVNDRPITRKYSLTRETKNRHRLGDMMDFLLVAGYSMNGGFTPSLSFVIDPDLLRGFGAGAFINYKEIGINAMYRIPADGFDNIAVVGMFGIDWHGNIGPGIGVGVCF
jgi:hypothetical protein